MTGTNSNIRYTSDGFLDPTKHSSKEGDFTGYTCL